MKLSMSLLLLTGLFLVSCRSRTENEVITFAVSRSDYRESINAEGTVQSVSNYPVVTPDLMFGEMTVVRLAADGQYVRKGDTICVLTLPELERLYSDLKTNVETQEAGLRKVEADNKINIAMLEAQLANSEARVKMARLDSLKRVYALDYQRKQQDLEMRKAAIEKRKIENKLKATRLQGETALLQARSRILQAKSTLRVYETQFNSLIILAGRDGMVMRVESPQIMVMGPGGSGSMGGGMIGEGSLIFMGTPVLNFPDMNRLQVSATVMEDDYRRIEKGQKVLISIGAAGGFSTTGAVTRKSISGRSNIPLASPTARFYEIIMSVDSTGPGVKPGLSAGCEIIIREAKDTVFVPAVAIFDRDSLKTVYVENMGMFTPVIVKTGVSGSSYTIISDGLTGGESIALSEPPDRLIRKVKKRKNNKKENLL